MQTNVTMPNFAKMVGALKGLNADMDKAISRTLSDCKQRAPAQVTKAVTAVYGIKAKDVNEAGKGAKRGAKAAGKIKVKGVSIDNLQLKYEGRLLTPIHFSMTPKVPPGGGRKYKVKAAILKGQKKVLHPGAFVAGAKKEGDDENKSGSSESAAPKETKRDAPYIAWRRVGKNRQPVYPIRTVSIPQMITNEKVEADIKVKIEELLLIRLQHNTERLASKK